MDPFAESFDDLVAPVVAECVRLSDIPLAFFGHSMGASVAYEVALRLQSERGIHLRGLFVSGRAAPGHERGHGMAESGDDELVEHLMELGGTDQQALDDPELRDLVLSAVRADYRLVEGYRPSMPDAALDAPVFVYRDDSELSEEPFAAWSAVTSGPCRVRSFEGGHFYLNDQAPDLVADILAALARV